MITVRVPEQKMALVQAVINGEYRLNELVAIVNEGDADIIVAEETIQVNPGWRNLQPPVLFSVSNYNNEVLLGLVYAALGNYAKAYTLLHRQPLLLQQVDLMNRLQNGMEIHFQQADNSYTSLHNKAIVQHYTMMEVPQNLDQLRADYVNAMQTATNADTRAFSAKHYALLLIDAGLLAEAETLLEQQLEQPLSLEAAINIKNELCVVWLKKLTVPYDAARLEKHKQYLWDCLEYYEAHNRTIEAAMLLSDAAYIANVSDSFSEALGYINRAIDVFEKETLTELLGDAFMKKGSILKRWAQHNNPQFFQQAAKAYQQALKIYNRETAPWLFADIHHQLGIIYSEIPDEVKKKSVWASVSVSSFGEALGYYNKVDHPYEFAIICNSQANAFTQYPDGLHTDNFEKALNWYREALDVQTVEQYPVERSLTLLNYLNANWYAGNAQEFNEARFTEMMAIANELCSISTDDFILRSAKEHLEKLKVLHAGSTAIIN